MEFLSSNSPRLGEEGVDDGHGPRQVIAHGSEKPPTAIIKSADMPEETQKAAIEIATEAMLKHSIEKDIAAFIKHAFDKKLGPTWHVVVGKNFGSYCTHETGNFLYFYMDHTAILLFKAG